MIVHLCRALFVFEVNAGLGTIAEIIYLRLIGFYEFPLPNDPLVIGDSQNIHACI